MKKSVLTALAMITQFGISVITPVLLCTLGAVWLRNKFGLGDFVVILGILIGIGAGIMTMIKMIRQMSDMAKKEDK
ncbi:MAG: AtpZ/AtpI family protein [Clostridia bacterium]